MKPTLWLLLSHIDQPAVSLAIPTVAWIAEDAGVAFEAYLEAPRDGVLFARTGSTVLGGQHHQQLNYLCALFDVKAIVYGREQVFASSLDVFGCELLAEADDLELLYEKLLAVCGARGAERLFAPAATALAGPRELHLAPYLWPEIFFRKALALPPTAAAARAAGAGSLYLSPKEMRALGDPPAIDGLTAEDTYASVTLRIAARHKAQARAVAFGDPDAIASMLPQLTRERRLAVFGELESKPLRDVRVARYTETVSCAAEQTGRLAVELGDRVIVGRQTGDGDLFHWARHGACMQIMDPNRPAFPIVATVRHRWRAAADIYADEPDETTLEKWAGQGKVLATLLWHSGEMAHNEAMLNLLELSCITGVKMGIGVHAARYRTAPQLWELIAVPRESGGVAGLIEPVLYSGGLGIMAEVNCPPADLADHCRQALAQIGEITGGAAVPRGFQAFMDTDLGTLEPADPAIYEAAASAGLQYYVTCAVPGRNRLLLEKDGFLVLNQSCRTVCNASPFVRITTVEDLPRGDSQFRPGWVIGTLDAPVIAFNPYIWRHGSRFMQLVDWLLGAPNVVNTTPHVIARYAAVLRRLGFLPQEPGPARGAG